MKLGISFLILLVSLSACSKSASNVSSNVRAKPVPTTTPAPDVKPAYTVEVSNVNEMQALYLTFSGKLPAPEAVDKILRQEFEKVVNAQPNKDAVGRAFIDYKSPTEKQYSGDLFYKAATKKISTLDEYYASEPTPAKPDPYSLITEEHHTFPGITPSGTWLSLSLVYSKTPTRKGAYAAVIAELEKAMSRHLDVSAFAYTGDKNKKKSWVQVRDAEGYVAAEYVAATNRLMSGGKLLKQF